MKKKQIYISDTIHGTILMSSLENIFLSSSAFNRLHDVSQNSTAYLTFPTNRTKRFEHSLGTMKLSGEMFYHGICNSSDDDIKSFFEDFIKQLVEIIDNKILSRDGSQIYRSILGDDHLNKESLVNYGELQKNIKNVFFNKFIPGNIEEEYKIHFLILFQSIRLSALLHDIGHPPYSHITENIITDVFNLVSDKQESERTSREKYFFDIINTNVGNAKLHESMGNKIAEKMTEHYCDSQKSKSDFHNMYFSVLVFNCVLNILSEKNVFFTSLHRLIDGAIDGDRLDYISRDVLNSGFKDGLIEYDRLLYSMIMLKKSENIYVFAPDVKSINTVEDVFKRRWRLYKDIVFHHRVAKTDSLLGESIRRLMLDYLMLGGDEEKSGSEKSLPDDISGLWKAIKFLPANNQYFDNISQWNDSWLITILKKEYLNNYRQKGDSVKFKLEELTSNKKNYYSLIKDKSDFDIIESSIESYFDEAGIENILTNDLFVKEKVKDDIRNVWDKVFKKEPLQSFIERLNVFFTVIDDKFKFYATLQSWAQKFIEDSSDLKDEIVEVLTNGRPMTTGLGTEAFIAKKGSLHYINTMSTIKQSLDKETLSPYFFIYVRYKNNILDHAKITQLLKELGSHLAKNIENKIKKVFNEKNNENE